MANNEGFFSAHRSLPGRFVVLEGLDGAGTTTQAARALAWLESQSQPAMRTAEPTSGPVGKLIRHSLSGAPEAPDQHCLPWLFAADRADHARRTILPALEAGQWVVCDRYVPSSLAYQSLTCPMAEIWQLNKHFRPPDALLYVHVPVDVALSRIAARGAAREIYEHREQLSRVAAAYEQAIALVADAGWPVRRIDGSAPIEAVWAEVQASLVTLSS